MEKEALLNKIKTIYESPSLSSLYGSDALPSVDLGESYLFLSYSHADYREVYSDILLLQKEGLHIWYDRGMVPGEEWSETAELYIGRFRCKGILLYLSPRGLSSSAMRKEIALAKRYGKPLIPILLTKENLTLVEMISRYVKDEFDRETLLEAFPDALLFMPVTLNVKERKEKIDNAMNQSELLAFQLYNDFRTSYDGVAYTVSSVSDSEIIDLKVPPLVELESPVVGVERAVFANFRKLRHIDNPPFRFVFDYAFLGCESLREISLREDAYIGQYAFRGCLSLERVNLIPKGDAHDYGFVAYQDHYMNGSDLYSDGPVSGVSDHAFEMCMALEDIEIPTNTRRIGRNAFKTCTNLRKVIFNEGLETIEEEAFSVCESLEEVILPDTVKEIALHAFSNCMSLRKVRLPKGLKKIPESLFYSDYNLEEVELDVDSLEEIDAYAFDGCPNLILDLTSFKGKLHEEAASHSPMVSLPK